MDPVKIGMIKIPKTNSMFKAKQFLFTFLSLMLLSCSDNISENDRKIIFTVQDFLDNSDGLLTRTSLIDGSRFIWSESDTVGIYPNTGSQVYFAMEEGFCGNPMYALLQSAAFHGQIRANPHKHPSSFFLSLCGKKKIHAKTAGFSACRWVSWANKPRRP